MRLTIYKSQVMESQEFASNRPPRHRRPGPWRWLVFGVLSLLFAFWAAWDLLPRMAGGLLGRGLEFPGGDSGVDWESVQVVWDPSPPAPEGDPAPTLPPAEESPPPDPSALVPESEPSSASASKTAGDDPGGARPAAGAKDPETDPGLARPGRGNPAGEGRRSPRVLYSAWPSQELLLELERSGRLRYRLRVETDGSVSEWELVDQGGFDCAPCRREAERIIHSLRFAPGSVNGRPVPCWVPYEISFERKDS